MSEQSVRIIAGLGNPGDKYEGTRHNIGFLVADRVAARLACQGAEPKFSGLAHDCRTEFGRLTVLKPLTYMNRSGHSVSAALRWFKSELDELLVVYDDLDLPFGEIRLRRRGSPAGHNGLKSIIEQCGSQEVPRLRVGIGRPSSGDTVAYVLSRFRPEEREELGTVVDHAADAAIAWFEHGMDEAMGRYNGVNILQPAE